MKEKLIDVIKNRIQKASGGDRGAVVAACIVDRLAEILGAGDKEDPTVSRRAVQELRDELDGGKADVAALMAATPEKAPAAAGQAKSASE